jgi:predicted Zn-dependent peptidase
MGYYAIYAGVAPENAAKVQEQIESIVRGMQDNPPTADELALAKNIAVSSHAIGLESSGDRARATTVSVLNGLGSEEMFHYAAEVEKVTPEQVQEQARKLMDLNNKVLIITAPPAQ